MSRAAALSLTVHNAGNGRPRMAGADEFEQFADTWRVDIAHRTQADDLLAVTVHGSQHAVALVPRRVLDEGSRKALHQAEKSSEHKVRGIHKEDLALACGGLR